MRTVLSATFIGLLSLMMIPAAQADDTATRIDGSKQAIKRLATGLQGELKQALQAGDAAGAISVCHTAAAAIGADISEQTGWQVGRTSLRVRNLENAPDAWELQTLQAFEARKRAGEPVGQLVRHAVVDQDGKRTFRFMKAIPTKALCLTCHGVDIAAPVADQIDRFYPADQARGFAEGDIRGAFTIVQPLD